MTLQIDRAYLIDLVTTVKEGVIVEIGSLTGKATAALAISGRPVYAIDLWDLTYPDDPRREKHRDLGNFKVFQQNTAGLNVIPVKGLSCEIAKVWQLPIGMLFIDGDHSYQGCMQDYLGYAKHVVADGVLAIHDYSEKYPGVMKAVKEIQGIDGWTDWKVAGFSTISARKRSAYGHQDS
jgi:hypothetical protein